MLVGYPQHITIDLDTADDHELLAGVPGKSIAVVDYALVCAEANTAQFKSGATPISGPLEFAANGGIAPGFNPQGHCKTALGQALVLSLSASESIGGHVTCIVGNF